MPNEKIRELKEELRKLMLEDKPSKVLVDTLGNLGYAYTYIDLDTSMDYGEQALEMAKAIGYGFGECRGYNVIGLVLLNKGDYPGSIECFGKLLQLSEKLKLRMGESSALGNIGSIHMSLGEYDKALYYYTEATKIDEEIDNKDGLVPEITSIGDIYSALGDYRKAIEYYEKAYSTIDKDSESLHLSSYITSILNKIASNYLSQNITEGVLDSIHRSLEIGIEAEDSAAQASSYEIMGQYFEKTSEYDESLESYTKSYDLFKTLGFKREMAGSSLNIGRINIVTGDLQTALNCLKRGIETAKEIGSRDIEVRGYQYLAELHEARSDCENSYRCYKDYRELLDEVTGKDIAEKIARMELAHEIEKKEKEAGIYRSRNIELKREIEKRRKAEEALRKSEEKFRRLSIEDPLTCTFNRRYFFKHSDQVIRRAVTENRSVCIGMMDIDYFKRINDNHGHQAGDFVLCEFTRIVSRHIRPQDLLARYGGEEFVVLFNDCDLADATLILERIRKAIEDYIFTFVDMEIRATVSGGIACSDEIDSRNSTFSEMVKSADVRMYSAKQRGRNMIVSEDILPAT